MNQSNLKLVASFFVLATPLLVAQQNEVSFSVGGIITSDQRATTVLPSLCCPPIVLNTPLETAPAFSFEASYARRIAKFGPAAVFAELPVLVALGHDVNGSTTGLLGPGISFSGSTVFSSSAFFVTPSARFKFLESRPISPFFTAGGGLAQFSSDLGISSAGAFSFSSNAGALQFGGGLDFRSPLPRLGFRAEVRDFYAGSRAKPLQQGSVITTTLSPVHLHHVFAGGGAFWRF